MRKAKQAPLSASTGLSSSNAKGQNAPTSSNNIAKSKISKPPVSKSISTQKKQLEINDTDSNQIEINSSNSCRESEILQACLCSKKVLCLSQSKIVDEDTETIGLFLSEIHREFEVIDFSKNALSDVGVLSLLIGIQAQNNLRELYFNDNRLLLGSALQGICTILPVLTQLEVLGLGGIGMEDQDLVKLCFALAEINHLKHIQLHRNSLTDMGLFSLIACCFSQGVDSSVETLHMGQNSQITELGLVSLFKSIGQGSMKQLHVNDIIMSDRALEGLSECLNESSCSLEVLNLANCGIDPAGFRVLESGLSRNSSLKALYLWSNYLNGESIKLLNEVIQKGSSRLQVLVMHDNQFGDGYEVRQSLDSLQKHLQVNQFMWQEEESMATALSSARSSTKEQANQKSSRIVESKTNDGEDDQVDWSDDDDDEEDEASDDDQVINAAMGNVFQDQESEDSIDDGEEEFLRLERQIEEDQQIIQVSESNVFDPMEKKTKKWQGFLEGDQSSKSSGLMKSKLI